LGRIQDIEITEPQSRCDRYVTSVFDRDGVPNVTSGPHIGWYLSGTVQRRVVLRQHC
jgi:hypothetical protein